MPFFLPACPHPNRKVSFVLPTTLASSRVGRELAWSLWRWGEGWEEGRWKEETVFGDSHLLLRSLAT